MPDESPNFVHRKIAEIKSCLENSPVLQPFLPSIHTIDLWFRCFIRRLSKQENSHRISSNPCKLSINCGILTWSSGGLFFGLPPHQPSKMMSKAGNPPNLNANSARKKMTSQNGTLDSNSAHQNRRNFKVSINFRKILGWDEFTCFLRDDSVFLAKSTSSHVAANHICLLQIHFLTNLGLILPQTVSKPL